MLRSEPAPTSTEPVANGLAPTVKELLPPFQAWLDAQRDETMALILLRALAEQSARVVHLPDPAQLEFTAEELAQACGWDEGADFTAATRKVNRADMVAYLDGRRVDREAFFVRLGLQHSLKVSKRSPNGRHRAQWFLKPYPLESPGGPTHPQSGTYPVEVSSPAEPLRIEYDYAPPGTVKSSWLARVLFGSGWFPTLSVRGFLFLCLGGLAPMVCIAFLALILWLMLSAKRPVTTSDLTFLVFAAALTWLLGLGVRSLWWLMSDRIIPAWEGLLSWREAPAQVESYRNGKARCIGLVRYSASCPVCAAQMELRYGEGNERRRLFGCCVEAPQEHVFTFDRVTRLGQRVR